jgi:hypothetical protein
MALQEFDCFIKNLRVGREIALNMRNQEKDEWTFEVTSLEKVPSDYLEVNEHSIKLAIKNGLRDIPGLKIYKGQRKTK